MNYWMQDSAAKAWLREREQEQRRIEPIVWCCLIGAVALWWALR